jgi:tRNA(fMet)-specific endonuclease VapC
MTPADVKLCSIVKAELLYGAARSNNPSAARKKLELFFAPYESFPFDDSAAVEYGRLRSQLAQAGTPIGPNKRSDDRRHCVEQATNPGYA